MMIGGMGGYFQNMKMELSGDDAFRETPPLFTIRRLPIHYLPSPAALSNCFPQSNTMRSKSTRNIMALFFPFSNN